MRRSRFPLLVTLFVLAFLYLPILVLMINSFNASRFGGEWTGFTLKWYRQLFQDRAIWLALKNSLVVAFWATLASTVVGSCAAYALHRGRSRLQKLHWGLIFSPLVVPDVLMGVSLLLLFVTVKMRLGLFTIFLAHTTFCISYVAMIVLSRLENFDFSVVEAAQDLGARGRVILTKVLLPLLAPGILSGALLAFTMSIDDYIVTSFVAGPGSTTLPLHVYGMIKFGATPLINALSTILLSVTFILIFLTQALTRKSL